MVHSAQKIECSQGSEIVVVGLKAANFLSRAFDFRPFECWCNSTDDAGRNVILQFEEIFQAAFEAICPDVHSAVGFDQLTGDSHPVTCLAYAAFEHVTNA